ncbi:hypothetical protein ISN45_Aa07g019210 [Arabidopsis thaliana x Arabidopsis arenosa]|uniref:Uncharacterized protein n=1 Tax=Arabidopsis thaliana x Arabidopsis arenosa TaxID=1240361 RepID=A0A8T1Y464_9BRAS|nr:hypothetical protein ISN45_Aa07g019210 [Arabidopsis thaliana x Arabidopsis arenosa]
MPPPCWIYFSKLGHRLQEMPVKLDPRRQYVRDCLLHSWSYLVERYYFVKIAIIEA